MNNVASSFRFSRGPPGRGQGVCFRISLSGSTDISISLPGFRPLVYETRKAGKGFVLIIALCMPVTRLFLYALMDIPALAVWTTVLALFQFGI